MYRVTDLEEFPFLDRTFYEATSKELRSRGWTYLAEIEDMEFNSKFPMLATTIRTFVDGKKETCAGIYEIKARGLWKILTFFRLLPLPGYVIDFETGTSNGHYIITTNTKGKIKPLDQPFFLQKQLPPETPIREMIMEHQRSIQQMMRSEQNLTLQKFRTVEDVIAFQTELAARKES